MDVIKKLDGGTNGGPNYLAYVQGGGKAAQQKEKMTGEAWAIWADPNTTIDKKFNKLEAIGIDIKTIVSVAAMHAALGIASNAAGYRSLKEQLMNENLANIAASDPRLALAVSSGGKNFSIGQATEAEAAALAKIWLGDGAHLTSGGGWLSADGTLGYRPPSPKKSNFATTGVQANFEMYSINPVTGDRTLIRNGHLNITP